ncbi:MAG: NAD(P)H-quinone oxidoreductase [Candidatus Odyssella sp.]|nr:NAD(P)H-quinone oxidoreductase [Candidatus Odyssella sp.]
MNALPARMKAIEIAQPGGPDVLKPGERPVPVPGPGEVLIRVAAAGVNRPDVEQRKGTYPPPPGASDIPGLEIAGTVAALGPDAGGLGLGDAVCALVSGGGYAEYCTAPVPQCLPVPQGLGMVEAAALPETFFTVWQNVFDRARLKGGETILIHGGSSGIGTAAIQMAKAMGARVLATAGSDDKCAACAKLGADRTINYNTQDFVEATLAATNKKGADVILDMVGGKYFERNVAALAIEGRLSLIALLGGREAKIDLGIVLRKRLTIVGSVLRARTVSEKGAVAASLRREIWPLIASGKIRPVIDSTFALADAAKAHARMETSAHVGKIVLTV